MNVRRNDTFRYRASELVLCMTAVWCASVPLAAQAAEPLALRRIMSELGRNMQTVTDGLTREDYEAVEKAARAIASHPQPPLFEKTRIIGFVGGNMGKFKAYDGETHDAATVLAAAANQKDGQGAINAFRKLQSSCLTCHQEFRKSFVEHFYGAR